MTQGGFRMVVNWHLIGWIVAIVALLGVYPITYLAYRGFIAEAHQERLKDDFRLLGLVKEDELDATVRGLYQTANNPWQFIAYILLILLLSTIILVGYFFRIELGAFTAETMALIFFSFLGAYTFSIQELVRRYNTFDLQPQVYSSILMRILVAVVITYAGASLLLASGGKIISEEGGGATSMAWAAIAAFAIGVFPSSGMRWIQRQANRILNPKEGEALVLPVRDIQGISDWHEARLQEMGIDDVQNLATVDIRKILLTTRFDTQEIISWIDQAILYTRVGDKYPRFKSAGINTYHEFRLHTNQLSKNDAIRNRSSKEQDQTEEMRKRLVAVLGLGDTAELDFLCDYSNFPNYVYIAEYYLRSGRIARQRASEGMGIILGPGAEEKDFEQAIEELERRVRHNPQDVEALVNLGTAYYGDNQIKEALKTLDRALKINPNMAIAYTNRARIFLDKGVNKNVIDDCTQAIRIDNRNKHTYNYRGMAHLRLNQVDAAIEDFDRTIELDDRFAAAYLNRGLASNSRGRFADAKEDFEAYYLLGERKSFELWLGWGTALLGMGKYHDAIAKLTTAISFEHPAVASAYSKRGYAYLQLNEPEYDDQARDDLNTAILKDSKLWEAYDNLGWLERRLNRFEQAVKIYLNILDQNPKRYATRYNLAMAYYRQNKPDEARKECKQVLEDAPAGSFEAVEAQKVLTALSVVPVSGSQSSEQTEVSNE
jgi:tetratricopeptide (TPR) repeat protein